jgi:hypothetical protein
MARKRPPARKASRKEAPQAVRINLPGRELATIRIPKGVDLKVEAMRWSHALRNRGRWNTHSDVAARQRKEMSELALRLGLDLEQLDELGAAPLAEVDIPWVDEKHGWELRVFPWEYMLASVTREARGRRPLTVVRCLRGNWQPRRGVPSSWLQVLSAPGKLAEQYDFASERELLKLAVGSFEGSFSLLRNPDEQKLRRMIAGRSPDVIHVSGFDSQQGLGMLDPHADEPVRDGYLLASLDASKPYLEAEHLAAALTSGEVRKPALVAFNIYNSAARIAPLCVAGGASAAIGFLDSFDDELAEMFFTVLYRAWQISGWDIVPAFHFAWQAVRELDRPLQGSGIVLWSTVSLLERAAPDDDARPDPWRAGIRERWRDKLALVALAAANVRQQLEVDVAVIPELNYSILHNNGPIFERFRVRKTDLAVGQVDGLQIRVDLHVGVDSYPFRMQATIPETAPYVDLRDAIRISLASALSRTLRESIHTSLLVEVVWQDTVLYQQTHRVTLLPVDEWRYDADSYRWLPSFVLPRDQAVLRVVDSAQRYLMALRDDATAGFDGYQAVERVRDVRPEHCTQVDLQVRALWSSLLYESPLSYINPPPTFTGSSQRLRTPSDCVEGRRGTCIDLALLLAACLEYVEIYPVIFLLRTHAFPAYWRHDSFHERFRLARTAVGRSVQEFEPSTARGQGFAWDFQVDHYREILGEVRAGRLVPLETTLVTGHGSFADAVADGIKNLASRREFESMLDIVLARTGDRTNVTPLPILRG